MAPAALEALAQEAEDKLGVPAEQFEELLEALGLSAEEFAFQLRKDRLLPAGGE